MVSFKVVAVGNSNVGKQCLLRTFAEGKYSDDDKQYESDGYKAKMELCNKSINLVLYKVNCEEKYARLRHLIYPLTDAFLVCFSLVDPESLDDAEQIWFPEITRHCPSTPIILVGTKGDLVDSKSRKRIHNKARALKKRLKLRKYLETSVMTNDGLHNVFCEAVHAVLRVSSKQIKKGKCDNSLESDKKCVLM